MSIQKYQALLKTIETGNITEAAQQLGYTQSAVSKMIQDLEAEWELSLLTRSRKGVQLTSAGEALMDNLRDIVKDFDNLNFKLSAIHGNKTGVLRVGCFASVSCDFLPPLLKSFHLEYPGIQIQLMHGEYSEIADWLRKGTIDCGFLGGSDAAEFDSTPLFCDELVAILPPGHPLAGAAFYPVSRIPQENYIALKEERDYDFAQFFDQNSIVPSVSYEVPSDLVLLSMVESGLGISVVYDRILQPPRFKVVRLPLDHPKQRTVCIAVRKGSNPPDIVNLFISHVAQGAARAKK